jgi:hypothetical protein
LSKDFLALYYTLSVVAAFILPTQRGENWCMLGCSRLFSLLMPLTLFWE